jgi:sodium/proline symporter
VAFSANATGESGWLLLGLTGMGYAVGAQAYWVIVGEMIGITASWGFISRKLKRLGDETDSITLPDVLAAKFDDRWHLIRGVAVAIIAVMVTTYVSAQMVATGKAFSGFIDLDYRAGVIIGAVIIISYTFVGGYKAVSYTDVVQGVLMLGGLIVVPLVAVNAAGGWGQMTATLHDYDPGFIDMFSVFDGSTAGFVAAASFAAIGLPFLGVPQMLIRYMSARDDEELKKARIVSIVVLFIFLFGAVTAGIAGRALFPALADSELVFPTLASELFPPLLTGLLLVIVLSAIMSTVDSLLLLASSAIVRDTLQKMLGSSKSDATLVEPTGSDASVHTSESYELYVDVADASIESFTVPASGIETESRTFREMLNITWHVTGGETHSMRTSFLDGELDLDDLSHNSWELPSSDETSADAVEVITVIRDERGGVSWLRRTLSLMRN